MRGTVPPLVIEAKLTWTMDDTRFDQIEPLALLPLDTTAGLGAALDIGYDGFLDVVAKWFGITDYPGISDANDGKLPGTYRITVERLASC